MGKYSLGEVTKEVSSRINKNNLYLNEKKSSKVVKDMDKQLVDIRASLLKVNLLLNDVVNKKMVTGSHVKVFKGWSLKAKSQAGTALKLKELLDTNYQEDVRQFPIKLLDNRIAELEKKIMRLTK